MRRAIGRLRKSWERLGAGCGDGDFFPSKEVRMDKDGGPQGLRSEYSFSDYPLTSPSFHCFCDRHCELKYLRLT